MVVEIIYLAIKLLTITPRPRPLLWDKSTYVSNLLNSQRLNKNKDSLLHHISRIGFYIQSALNSQLSRDYDDIFVIKQEKTTFRVILTLLAWQNASALMIWKTRRLATLSSSPPGLFSSSSGWQQIIILMFTSSK